VNISPNTRHDSQHCNIRIAESASYRLHYGTRFPEAPW
jgi:hypothetical protein